MATHSSILVLRIPRTVEPGGLQSMGSHRVRHDWDNLAQHTLIAITIIEELLWGVSENRTLRPVPIHHPTLLLPLVSCESFHCLCKLKRLNIFIFLLFLQKMTAVVILQFVFAFNEILKKKFLLVYSWFIMLFQVYRKVTQLYMYIYPVCKFFSHILRVVSRAPCAIQWVP